MSAKRFPTLVIITGTVTWIGAFGPGHVWAQNANAVAQVADQRPTREEADLLLRQARSAIQQNKLDEAEALVRRAESANLRYSLFHLGPTPVAVRRELNRARAGQTASATSKPQAGKPADPFLARDHATAVQFGGQPQPSPANALGQPLSSNTQGDARGAVVQASAQAAQDLPSLSTQVANPYAPVGDVAASLTHKEASRPNRYPVTQAGGEQYDGLSMATDDGAGVVARDAGNWALPNAPTPRGVATAQTPALAGPGLMPPQRDTIAFGASGDSRAVASAKQQALAQLRAAREALDAGDVDMAESLARAASSLGVPESQFLPDEDRPSLVAWEIQRTRSREGGPLPPAVRLPATAPASATPLQQPGIGESALSASELSLPAGQDPGPWSQSPEPLALPDATPLATEPRALPTRPSVAATLGESATAMRAQAPIGNSAQALLQAGETALAQHDRQGAHELFAQAHSVRAELNGAEQARLQDRLQMLAAEPVDTTLAPAELPMPMQSDNVELPTPPTVSPPAASSVTSSPEGAGAAPANDFIEAAADNEKALTRQLSAEVGRRQSEAKRLRDTDAERAVALLKEAQQMVEQSKVAEASKRELVGRINITLVETQKYIGDNKAALDLDKQNEAVLADVARRREVTIKVQQKTAEMIEEFNRLRDEQRYAEAEIIAKRLIEMSPDDPVAQQVYQTAKFIRREMMNRSLADQREDSFWKQLNAVEESAINPVAEDGNELVFNQKTWDQFAKNRKGSRDRLERRTERELEIERRLKTPVMLRYNNTPLSQVVDDLSELTSVNIHLDPRGLEQEGYNSDTTITISLAKEISLKSALNLILEPLHLSYVIKDEVLKITSEQLRDGELKTYTYNVADLVIPIPNFVPNSNIGLQGLINDAHAAMGYGGNGVGLPGPAVLVNGRSQKPQGSATDQVLAQQFNGLPAGATGGLSGGNAVPIGAGPGGMGGGANADFDSLIDLIVSTVHTETWAENGGGDAEIRPFPTNLSLVISQTQAVHEEIADLLEQLRRLQDLQVTIEVRFIRLNDRFFERIGIDFDMNIEDRTVGTADLIPGQVYEPNRQSATVGIQAPVTGIAPFPNFTADLDIPFRQDGFLGAAPPPFSGFDANQAARFGFAILSDIEAYFLIEAAQGDSRTNVLNAPKVTLFNGQQAFVADAVSQPFVIGVIPVVGEFVAAQQPVIVVLNEGTMMTIQAVVSDDRRYVRLTVVPFFTQVGDVKEFTFEGSSSTTNSSSSTDDDDDGRNEAQDNQQQQARSGVTVQLPAFQFVSVVTTVSVPDGGTVLLGGIKRLSEGRNEFGVPLLSKVPYINRLFRNVGIGRDTDSLMMMVTPRIIIQEEEEEALGVPVP